MVARRDSSRPARSPTLRPPAARAQGEAAGSQLVDTLNGLVEELISENRRLRKQVAKLSAGGGATAAGLERSLKAIQKRIERTLGGTRPAKPAPRRPTRTRRRPDSPPG